MSTRTAFNYMSNKKKSQLYVDCERNQLYVGYRQHQLYVNAIETEREDSN